MKYFVFITLQVSFDFHAEVMPVEIYPSSLTSTAQGKAIAANQGFAK